MALTDKLTAIGDAIRAKIGTTDLIPLTDMPSKITDGFQKIRDKLDSCLDGSVTEIESDIETMMPNCFRGCVELVRARFPKLKAVGGYGLYSCERLEEVYLPVAEAITTSSFYRDAKLPRVDLPAVKQIAATAFYRCAVLDTVILRSPTLCALTDASAFGMTPIESGTGYIYVPSSLVEEYKAATNWVVYANQFRAIEDYPEICEPN